MFWGGGLGLRRISGSRGLKAFGRLGFGFQGLVLAAFLFQRFGHGFFGFHGFGNPYMLANHMKLRPDTANRDSQVA